MLKRIELEPRIFLLVFAVYFSLQFLVRWFTLEALTWDLSEQAFFSQWYALGYGIQPPLFNWLQKALIDISGNAMFSLLLLKVLVVAGTHVWVYKITLEVTGRPVAAAASVLIMFLFPQYFWESLRDLSHTLIATHFCAALLYFSIRTFKDPSIKNYLWLGVSVGFALISKYNTVLFITAMLLAALLFPNSRQAVFNKKFLSTILVALLIVSPHCVWLFQQFVEIYSNTFDKVSSSAQTVGFFQPIAGMLLGFLAFSALFWLVTSIVTFKKLAFINLANNESLMLLCWFGLILTAMITCTVVLGEITELKDRYFQTFYIFLPVIAASLIDQQYDSIVFQRLLRVTIVIGSIVTLAVFVMVYFGDTIGEKGRYNKPFSSFSDHIEAERQQPDIVITNDFKIAGNLVALWPEATVISLDHPEYKPSIDPNKSLLVVWEYSQNVPDSLNQYVSDHSSYRLESVEGYSAFYHHSKRYETGWFYSWGKE